MLTTEATIPIIVGRAPQRRKNNAMIRLPRRAPLVKPRSENAALSTNSTWRESQATSTSTTAQPMVEALLKRRKNASLRPGDRGLRKSIVETDASAVMAELMEDMAAARIATMRKPLSR